MTVLDAGAVYVCLDAACPACQLRVLPGETRAAWAERVREFWGPHEDSSPLNGRWSRAWPCCRDCGTTEREHSTGGRCHRCYNRLRREQWRMAS